MSFRRRLQQVAADLRAAAVRRRRPINRQPTIGGSLLLSGLLIAALVTSLSAPAQELGTAPVKNFVLPIFTKEGPRSVTLRGTAASRPSEKQIDIVDLYLTRFSGDAAQTIDDILLAPEASFFPDQHLAKGDKAVRLIRDEAEISGEIWTYDHEKKKVTIDKNVRVVFHSQVKDIIK